MSCTVPYPHGDCSDVTHIVQVLKADRDHLQEEVDRWKEGFRLNSEESDRRYERAERAEKQARELAEAIRQWKTIGIDKKIERHQATDNEKGLVEALAAYTFLEGGK